MINFRPLCEPKLKNPRSALLFRSGELINLTPSEIKTIAEDLSITAYIDLRSPEEIESRGKPLGLIAAGVEWKSFPLQDANHYFRTKLSPDYYDYFDSYIGLLENNQDSLRQIFLFLSKHYLQPCVFGCYAGKDRTGLLAMLLMMLLRFSSEDIIDEYTASAEPLLANIDYFENNWKKKGWTKQDYLPRLAPSPETASLMIGYICTTFGSIEGYLASLGIQYKQCADMITFTQKAYPSLGGGNLP